MDLMTTTTTLSASYIRMLQNAGIQASERTLYSDIVGITFHSTWFRPCNTGGDCHTYGGWYAFYNDGTYTIGKTIRLAGKGFGSSDKIDLFMGPQGSYQVSGSQDFEDVADISTVGVGYNTQPAGAAFYKDSDQYSVGYSYSFPGDFSDFTDSDSEVIIAEYVPYKPDRLVAVMEALRDRMYSYNNYYRYYGWYQQLMYYYNDGSIYDSTGDSLGQYTQWPGKSYTSIVGAAQYPTLDHTKCYYYSWGSYNYNWCYYYWKLHSILFYNDGTFSYDTDGYSDFRDGSGTYTLGGVVATSSTTTTSTTTSTVSGVTTSQSQTTTVACTYLCASGDTLTQLSTADKDERWPYYNMSGNNRIVYQKVDTDGERLYLMDSGGANQVSIFDLGYQRHPSLGPAYWESETVDAVGDVGRYSSIDVYADDLYIVYYNLTSGDLLYATNKSGSWVIESVDATGDVGKFCDIRVDGSGNVHVCYYDETNDDLKYAKRTTSWAAAAVDETGSVGTYCSVDIDSSNNPHVSYYDETNGNLKYAVNTGSWSTEAVDSTDNVGGYTSIDVDGSNDVHISYHDFTNQNLDYATGTAGSFSTETLESTDAVGEYSSIIVSSAKVVHISYYDATNRDLKYITNSSGSWAAETLDSTNTVGQYTSIALDSSSNPHISYFDPTRLDLKYAKKTSTGWVTGAVDSIGHQGMYSSLELDSSDSPHISYYDGVQRNLKHSYKTGAGERILFTYYLATTGEYGVHQVNEEYAKSVETIGTQAAYWGTQPAVKADSSGNPHVVYWDYSIGMLKYAKKSGGTWTYQNISSIPGYWYYRVGLDIDSNDVVHVAITQVHPNYNLVYWNNSGGTWTSETVDSNTRYYHLDLAVDSSDNPQIVYYKAYPSYDLRYAKKSGGTWTTSDIDTIGNTGYYPSIAIDSLDNVHVSYFKSYYKDLMYAYKTAAGSSWTIEDVDTEYDRGYWSTIGVDSSNQPSIVYQETYPNYTIRYAKKRFGSWVKETVADDATARYGYYTTFDLDTKGNPHIVYHVGYPGYDLYYTRKMGDEWETEYISQTGYVGRWCNIDVDDTDAAHIVYFDTTNYNLKYARYSGSFRKLTSNNNEESNPKFSPEGTKIAYTKKDSSESRRNTQIWIMNADGTQETQLTQDTGWKGHPDWINDTLLVYHSSSSQWCFAGGTDTSAIWRINLDGTGSTQMTRTDLITCALNPSVSEGGGEIVFDDSQDLWIMKATGAGQTKLTTDGATTEFITNVHPAFNSDGSRVVFESTRDGKAYYDIWTMECTSVGTTTVAGTTSQPATTSQPSTTTVPPITNHTFSEVAGIEYVDRPSGGFWVAWYSDGTYSMGSTHNRLVGVGEGTYSVAAGETASKVTGVGVSKSGLSFTQYSDSSWGSAGEREDIPSDLASYGTDVMSVIAANDTVGVVVKGGKIYNYLANGSLFDHVGENRGVYTIKSGYGFTDIVGIGYNPDLGQGQGGNKYVAFYNDGVCSLGKKKKLAKSSESCSYVVGGISQLYSTTTTTSTTSTTSTSTTSSTSTTVFTTTTTLFIAGECDSTDPIDVIISDSYQLRYHRYSPRWSPDGKYLVYWKYQYYTIPGSWRRYYTTGIWRTDLDGNEVRLTEITPISGSSRWWGATCVMVDGTKVCGSWVWINDYYPTYDPSTGEIYWLRYMYSSSLPYSERGYRLMKMNGDGSNKQTVMDPSNFRYFWNFDVGPDDIVLSGYNYNSNSWRWQIDLFLLKGKTGGWTTEQVDSGLSYDAEASVALDSSGEPHICYYDGTQMDLLYAFRSSGNWNIETVDSSGTVGRYCSIAVDSNGVPHISYYDDTNDDLKYASRSGGSWSTAAVDETGSVGLYTSIDLDSSDNPHICYYDGTNTNLKYAKKTTSWATETADSSGSTGKFCSIDTDGSATPHISYVDSTNKYLRYARKVTSTSWYKATVDSAYGSNIQIETTSQKTSIKVDSNGKAHISYLHYDTSAYKRELMYSTQATVHSWTQQYVATLVGPSYTSLALDSGNSPHIAAGRGQLTLHEKGTIVPLTSDTDYEGMPRFYNDGQGVVFSKYSRTSGGYDILYMNSDGSDRKRLLKLGYEYWPEVDEGAQKIIFFHYMPYWGYNQRRRGLHSIQFDGRKTMRLFTDSYNYWYWNAPDHYYKDTSPPGSPGTSNMSLLAYNCWYSSQYGICIMNCSGGTTTTSTSSTTTTTTSMRFACALDDTHIQLTIGNYTDAHPTIHANYTMVAFQSKMYGGNTLDIWNVNYTDYQTERLTWKNYDQHNPRYSTDGETIIYVRTRNDKSDLVLMNHNVSDITQITAAKNSDHDYGYPGFNGTRVVYASREDGGAYYDIWRMNANGTSHIQITTNNYDQIEPSLSSNGADIVYASKEDGGAYWDLWRIASSGSSRSHLTTEDHDQRGPSWADDEWMMYHSKEDGGSYFDLWVINYSGTERIQVTTEDWDQKHPTVKKTEDQVYVAYASQEDGEGWYDIWMIYCNGTTSSSTSTSTTTSTSIYVSESGCVTLTPEISGYHRKYGNSIYKGCSTPGTYFGYAGTYKGSYWYRGFQIYNIRDDLPANPRIDRAQLKVRVMHRYNSYSLGATRKIGSLIVDHGKYTCTNEDDWGDTNTLPTQLPVLWDDDDGIPDNTGYLDKTIDVTTAVRNDALNNRTTSGFRFRSENDWTDFINSYEYFYINPGYSELEVCYSTSQFTTTVPTTTSQPTTTTAPTGEATTSVPTTTTAGATTTMLGTTTTLGTNAPTMSDVSRWPARGGDTTWFYINVTYTDADNEPPKSGYPKLVFGSFRGNISAKTMIKSDLDDNDYTDGVVYTIALKGSDLGGRQSIFYAFEMYDRGSNACTGMRTQVFGHNPWAKTINNSLAITICDKTTLTAGRLTYICPPMELDTDHDTFTEAIDDDSCIQSILIWDPDSGEFTEKQLTDAIDECSSYWIYAQGCTTTIEFCGDDVAERACTSIAPPAECSGFTCYVPSCISTQNRMNSDEMGFFTRCGTGSTISRAASTAFTKYTSTEGATDDMTPVQGGYIKNCANSSLTFNTFFV